MYLPDDGCVSKLDLQVTLGVVEGFGVLSLGTCFCLELEQP